MQRIKTFTRCLTEDCRDNTNIDMYCYAEVMCTMILFDNNAFIAIKRQLLQSTKTMHYPSCKINRVTGFHAVFSFIY